MLALFQLSTSVLRMAVEWEASLQAGSSSSTLHSMARRSTAQQGDARDSSVGSGSVQGRLPRRAGAAVGHVPQEMGVLLHPRYPKRAALAARADGQLVVLNKEPQPVLCGAGGQAQGWVTRMQLRHPPFIHAWAWRVCPRVWFGASVPARGSACAAGSLPEQHSTSRSSGWMPLQLAA